MRTEAERKMEFFGRKEVVEVLKEMVPFDENPDVDEYEDGWEMVKELHSFASMEVIWRGDSRAQGRKRVWCPSYSERWDSFGWAHKHEIAVAREYLARKEVAEELELSPAFSGVDFQTCGPGAVMAARKRYLRHTEKDPSLVWAKIDFDSYLTLPRLMDIAFECGEVKQWETSSETLSQDINRMIQWYNAVGIDCLTDFK